MLRFCVPLALLWTGAPAEAVVYQGNPTAGFHVDRPAGDLVSGSVSLTKLRIHACNGTWTDYPVGAIVDPVAGYSLVVSGGDLCGATWYWGSAMVLQGNNGAAFTLSYGAGTTSISFAPSSAALTPYTVVSGTVSGSGPRLYGTMN